MNKRSLKPLIKWAGGKSQLIESITSRFPLDLGGKINKYAEPFIGGGAILFHVLETYDLESIYVSDTNVELINMYQTVKYNVDDLIPILKSYESKYLSMDEDGRKAFFYEMRDDFNSIIKKTSQKETLNTAALFIFLNHTCFNGLYRVNKSGLFNVPVGKYKNPKICDEENLRAVSAALQRVEIICGDYHLSEDFIDSNTLVYFDPPYRPLNATSKFTSYTENSFDDMEQGKLAEFAKMLSAKGALVILSNSDPTNTDPNDTFFDDLYSDFYIERISATRMINRDADARGKINELLIRNFN